MLHCPRHCHFRNVNCIVTIPLVDTSATVFTFDQHKMLTNFIEGMSEMSPFTVEAHESN